MRAKIYYNYVNLNYLQKVICFGDVFGVPIRNIDARTREGQPQRIYFTNGRKRQGFIDARENNFLSENYFELYSPLGKIKGHFCQEMDPSIHFSVSVFQKPYDKITGFYNASFPKYSSEEDAISQSMRCSLKKEEKLVQTIDFYSGLEFGQCYTNSPFPYERLFIRRSGMADFTLIHAKDFDKANRSLAIQSKITKKDSTIHMMEPVDLTVECEGKKAYPFDYANLELDKIYGILSEYDDGIRPCLDRFHQLLTFRGLDLYQNMVSACFPSMDQHTASLLTGVEKAPYQKNLSLVSRLNAQKR